MKVFRWLAAAFSMYSRIPVPGFKTKEDDMKNCIMFLPLVGLVVAAVLFGLIRLMSGQPVPVSVKGFIAVIVPLVITGGFHVDGFMDTVDALSSYGEKEKKLLILADPHIGSFAVIRFVVVTLLMASGLCVVINIETTRDIPAVILACGIFVISRAVAAMSSLLMKKAKDDGMLQTETSGSETAAMIVLFVQLIAALSFMVYVDAIHTGVIILAFIIFTLYYRYKVNKNFGGVTGDTAGYYITAGEVFALIALAISLIITTGMSNVA